MISVKQRGSFDNSEKYLNHIKKLELDAIFNKYGNIGVEALSNATPKESGLTAGSWYYEVIQRPGYYSIRWYNSHVEEGRPIAILLQYGHGTGTGGYVSGRDYIMPAIRPIFEQIDADIQREVSSINGSY